MRKDSELDSQCMSYGKAYPYAEESLLSISWCADRIMELTPPATQRTRLLELGIGFGCSTPRLLGKFRNIVLVDGSADAIARFRKRHPDLPPGVEIVRSMFEEFEAGSRFDVIVMGFVLEHVEDPAFVLRRMGGFLKPKGSVFVAVPNFESLNRRIGFEAGLLDDMKKLGEADLSVGHRRLFSTESLARLARKAGLAVKRTEGVFLKPITTAQMKALGFSGNILSALLRIGKDYPELCANILAELKPIPSRK